ncbi:hypothetical protein YPPY06_1626, partial [Yersinia pestis PY-06]
MATPALSATRYGG